MMRYQLLPILLFACLAGASSRTAVAQAVADNAAHDLSLERNPAVLAALELPRSEPKHYLQAVLALVDLNRPELAAPIMQQLAGLQLTDEQRAVLVAEFGSHRMLQLARNAALAPSGAQFAEACMAASAKRNNDPQRVEQLIANLNAPTPAVRSAARFDLASTGEAGAVAAIEAFAHETDAARRQNIAVGLVALNPVAVDPLLSMVTTQDATLRHDVIRVLKAMQVTLAKPFIAGTTSTATAERLLDDAIGRNKRGMRTFTTDENDEAAIWHWDDAARRLSAHRYPIGEAQTIWAARLAIEYARLRAEDRLAHCQALVLGLEADALSTGRPSPAVLRLIETADNDMLNMVLTAAMTHDLPHAAMAAAKLLGKRGDAGVLMVSAPNVAPLAAALSYPDRRVRFAALGSIMQLDPQLPFPGASRVPETLGYFATGSAVRRAVVAMPVADHASTLAGRLRGSDIDADPFTRGGAAVAQAQGTVDLEMVLVDIDIDRPGIRDVIYGLRTNPATGQVPIGLLATTDRLDAARRLANEHTRVVAFPRPQSDEALHELIDRLAAVDTRRGLTPEQRAAMAGQALEWLGDLLGRDHTFYDLHRQAPIVVAALYQPAMAPRALRALALVGTPASQRSLVDFASHLSVPVASRQLAAEAFATSVRQHGILLTEAEILRQYDRYNASESLDGATQRVFGSLLDAIESLRAQADASVPHRAAYHP